MEAAGLEAVFEVLRLAQISPEVTYKSKGEREQLVLIFSSLPLSKDTLKAFRDIFPLVLFLLVANSGHACI